MLMNTIIVIANAESILVKILFGLFHSAGRGANLFEVVIPVAVCAVALGLALYFIFEDAPEYIRDRIPGFVIAFAIADFLICMMPDGPGVLLGLLEIPALVYFVHKRFKASIGASFAVLFLNIVFEIVAFGVLGAVFG